MNLLRYIKNRKGKDAHRLELEAMHDPFLHDAMEGIDSVQGNHTDSISRLQSTIRRDAVQKKRFPVWAVAASLAILLGVGTYLLLPQKEDAVFVSHEITNAKEESADREPKAIQEQSSSLDKSDFSNEIREITPSTPATRDEEKVIPFVQQPSEAAEIMADELSIANADEIISTDDIAAVKEDYKDAERTVSKVYVPPPSSRPYYEMGTENTISVRNATKRELERSIVAESAKVTPSKIAQSQTQKSIKGKVVDEQGEPVIGAIVQQKKTGAGTITDMDGNFTLHIDSILNDAIAISSIGYQSQTMKVNHLDNDLLIAMHEDTSSLDEVVVSGRVAAKKKETAPVKNKPEPVMGIAAYKNYLKNNITQPTDEKCANAKGKVILTFHINESGQPYNIKVKKSLCPSADSIAVDLLRNGGKWTYSTQSAEIEVTFK